MADINDMTEPIRYLRLAPPMREGMSVAGAEERERGHRCGKCASPFTRFGGNEACPNNLRPVVEVLPRIVPDDDGPQAA